MEQEPWTIAVVDDDPSLCRALARLLRVAHYHVRTYASGEAYLADPLHGEVDFLVLDIQLSGMSGFELQRQLAHARKAPPIAYITAHDEPSTRDQARQAGGVAYLRKPFAGQELFGAISRTLGGAAPAHASA